MTQVNNMSESKTVVNMKPSDVIHDLALASYAIKERDEELLDKARADLENVIAHVSRDALSQQGEAVAPFAYAYLSEDKDGKVVCDLVRHRWTTPLGNNFAGKPIREVPLHLSPAPKPQGEPDWWLDETEGKVCRHTPGFAAPGEDWIPLYAAPAADELASLRGQLDGLTAAIAEKAKQYAPDYPGVATADAREQLYAISCAVEGAQQACDDLHAVIRDRDEKLAASEARVGELLKLLDWMRDELRPLTDGFEIVWSRVDAALTPPSNAAPASSTGESHE